MKRGPSNTDKLRAYAEGIKTELAILEGLRQQHEKNIKILLKEIEGLL